MKLRYTNQALVELDDILSSIAIQSPRGADRVRGRIKALTDQIERFPLSGKPTNFGAVRRVLALPYPYLLFYVVMGEDVVVIGVRHGARDPATMPGADNR